MQPHAAEPHNKTVRKVPMVTGSSPLHSVVVGCLVRNEKNEVLLIRHQKRGWEIPQGRVEEGENLLDAL